MSFTSLIVLLLASFGTAFLSGIFGMAGGLVLMGVLLSILPVPQAMLAHGVLQMLANGWRSFLLRKSIQKPIIIWYLIGAVIAVFLLFLIAWRPEKLLVFFLLGMVPLLVWLPTNIIHLDAQKPAHAVLAGFLVTALNTFAGVAGPALDVFFVRTHLTRHQIVATKSITQVIAHFVKIVFWGGVFFDGFTAQNSGLFFALVLAMPLSIMGTWFGSKILNRLHDKIFLQWVKVLVTLIGLIYLLRAARVFIGQ